MEQPLEVQLTATETAGLSVSVSFTLYVTNVNDPVSQTRAFEPVQSLGTPASAGVVLDLAGYVSDPDPGEVLSYAASVSGASVVSLDLSGSQLGLRVAPASPYHFGLAEVSVTIQDRAGSSVSDSFIYRHTHLTLSDDLFSDGAFGAAYEDATLWEVGDIDGDGFSDAGGFTSGAGLALFFGGPDGVSKEVSLSVDSSVSDFTFGPAGDVNGDGLADLWLTEGRDEVYVLFGSPSLRSVGSVDLETLPRKLGLSWGLWGRSLCAAASTSIRTAGATSWWTIRAEPRWCMEVFVRWVRRSRYRAQGLQNRRRFFASFCQSRARSGRASVSE